MLKKIIAVICAVSIIFAAVAVSVSAEMPESSYDLETPVVVVAGFLDSPLAYNDGNGNYTDVTIYSDEADDILEALSDLQRSVPVILRGLLTGDYSKLRDYLKENSDFFAKKLEWLQMNYDGVTSMYNVHLTHDTSAKATQGVYIFPQSFFREAQNMGMRRNNLFSFFNDSRVGQLENARLLDDYIGQVKEMTGKDKVRLFGYSGGGQIITTYLAQYGDKNDVAGVVMNNSPILGTSLTTALLDKEHFNPNYPMFMALALNNDFQPLLSIVQKLNMTLINNVVYDIINQLVVPYIINWGGIWDMVPAEDYDRLKAEYLDPVKHAELIAASDKYHHEIMPKIPQMLADLQKKGVTVSVVTGTGYDLLADSKSAGDGIVDSVHATGATILSHYEQFPAGYRQVNDCGGRYMVSGDRRIDASTSFLPMNTWFLTNAFHDTYAAGLAARLSLSKEQPDIDTFPDFPQFRYNPDFLSNIKVSVNAGGQMRYLTTKDNSFTVTNTGRTDITILSIKLKNSGLSVNAAYNSVVEAYGDHTFSLSGNITSAKAAAVDCVITYRVGDKFIPHTEHLTFTANPTV
ncbi:MAG: alpha/beta hydrolase [Clostridiales bacterium]|nr:alpha/beta hydrolase [Clostridiales bacterium]